MTSIIFSLGHSSHSWDNFRALVEQSNLGCVIDVPQRRERVFALGYVGTGPARRDPREILFDEAGEGWRPSSTRRARKTPIAVPEGSADPIGGFEGPVIFMAGQGKKARSIAESSTVSPTLRSKRSGSNQVPTIAYVARGRNNTANAIEEEQPRYIVRRLTPVETERLQGFPENWTAVEVNGETIPDVARYECIGNSMAVDVMRWIGRRLDHAVRGYDAEAAA